MGESVRRGVGEASRVGEGGVVENESAEGYDQLLGSSEADRAALTDRIGRSAASDESAAACEQVLAP